MLPLSPPAPLDVALRKIADGVPLTREEREIVEQRLEAIEVARVLAKIHACEDLTDDEAAFARAHQHVLTAADMEDAGVTWEEERARLLGEDACAASS